MGRYVLYGELGSGGMATVRLGRLVGAAGFTKTVAVKGLHEHLASEPEFVAMLTDEAKLVSAIHHPNVVSTLDLVREGNEVFIVMEYVEGETLAALLRETKELPPRLAPPASVVSRIVLDALAGLHAAHTAKTSSGRPLNIVHRDVSPQNVIVGVDGVARVLDFGIAKAEDRCHTTRPGRIRGKFAYMSPEQVRGSELDARTDVFATGVVLWECLAHERLFAHRGDDRAAERVLSMPVPPPSTRNGTIPEGVDVVVLRALARDASVRYASAAEFAEALYEALPPARPAEVSRWVRQVAEHRIAEQDRATRDLETSALTERHTGAAGIRPTGTTLDTGPQARRVPNDAPTVPLMLPRAERGRDNGRVRVRGFVFLALAAALVGAALGARGRFAEPPKREHREDRGIGVRPAVVRAVSVPANATTPGVPRRDSSGPAIAPPLLPVLPAESAHERATKAPHHPATGRRGPVAAARTAPGPRKPAGPETAPSAVAGPSCDPPYRVDAEGIRVLRGCL